MNNKSSYSLVSMSSILVNNKNQVEQSKIFIIVIKQKYGNEKNKVNNQDNNNKISTKDNNFDDHNINKNQSIKEKLNRKPSLNTVYDMNNIGNKELFIEFLKFTNGIYKDKYFDENQKKLLKQLIIYIWNQRILIQIKNNIFVYLQFVYLSFVYFHKLAEKFPN